MTIAYVGNATPFGKPHQLGASSHLDYRTAYNKYRPQIEIKRGKHVAYIVAVSDDEKTFGTVQRISRHRKLIEKTVTFTCGMSQLARKVKMAKCIPVHEVNSFIRDVHTKNWYKVMGHNKTTLTVKAVTVVASATTTVPGVNDVTASRNSYSQCQVLTYLCLHVAAQNAAAASATTTVPGTRHWSREPYMCLFLTYLCH